MTRLIDADVFEKNLENEWRLQEISNNDLTQIREWLAQEQTVDAVPVEYILKQIVKLERSKGQSYHAICYRHLIEVWAMENERKEE